MLCASGVVLSLGLAAVYVPALRRLPFVVAAVAAAGLAAAALPDMAPLVAQAAAPGAVLAIAAGLLRSLIEGRTAPPQGHMPAAGASSLTQVAAPGSLIITAPPPSRVDDATAIGRIGS